MNITGMMKQAKQMQEKMQVLQEEVSKLSVEGSSGGGMVKVVMSCKGMVQSIDLDPAVVVADDKEVLEDLITAAMNDARSKGDAKTAEETQKLMSEMGLPAGMMDSMPF